MLWMFCALAVLWVAIAVLNFSIGWVVAGLLNLVAAACWTICAVLESHS